MKLKDPKVTSLALPLLWLAFLSGICANLCHSVAYSYPSKPVRLIVPFAPGGPNDIVARLISPKLTDLLGKQIVVENRAGAGGLIGTELASKADPDGHTLLLASDSYAIRPALYKKLPYDPEKAFSPIAKLGSGPIVLVVHQSVPAKTLGEFIALARQKPGQLIYASGGVGTQSHLAAELLRIKAKIDFKIVQFKGGGPAMIDLLGGHSHFTLRSLLEAMPHIRSGKFRPLGTGGLKRTGLLPDVPTIAESGITGYETSNWWGIVCPAGVPKQIINRLTDAIKSVLATDELKKQFHANGSEVDYLPPSEFGRFIEKEIVNWKYVVGAANIRLEE